MRHVIVAFALLVGACACGSEDMQGDAAEPQRIKVGEGKYEPQAGSAALPSDGAGAGVAATCTDAAYCSKARSTIASYLGGSWSWSGSCSSQTWNATGSGGRTLQAKYITLAPGNPLYQHSVWASQTANFQNICSCSNGNVSCSNNPGF